MNKYPYLLCVLLTACGSSTSNSTKGDTTMFLSKPAPSDYVISSPLEGVLTKDGKPLSDTKMLRRLTWNGSNGELQEIKQEYLTDKEGKFSLPSHEETLALGALEEFVGSTYIDAEIDGEIQFLWYSAKNTKELNSEYDSPPIDLVCDVNQPEAGVDINLGTCLTVCQWSNIPKDDLDNEL